MTALALLARLLARLLPSLAVAAASLVGVKACHDRDAAIQRAAVLDEQLAADSTRLVAAEQDRDAALSALATSSPAVERTVIRWRTVAGTARVDTLVVTDTVVRQLVAGGDSLDRACTSLARDCGRLRVATDSTAAAQARIVGALRASLAVPRSCAPSNAVSAAGGALLAALVLPRLRGD